MIFNRNKLISAIHLSVCIAISATEDFYSFNLLDVVPELGLKLARVIPKLVILNRFILLLLYFGFAYPKFDLLSGIHQNQMIL